MVLTFRIDPRVKEAAKKAAQQLKSTLSQYIQELIKLDLWRKGLLGIVAGPKAPVLDHQKNTEALNKGLSDHRADAERQSLDNPAPSLFHQLRSLMEPAVGIEPTTDGLQNRCSTAELCRQTHDDEILMNGSCGQDGF